MVETRAAHLIPMPLFALLDSSTSNSRVCSQGVDVTVHGEIVKVPTNVINTVPDNCETEGTYDVIYRCDDIVCDCCCCKAQTGAYKRASYATARRVISGANCGLQISVYLLFTGIIVALLACHMPWQHDPKLTIVMHMQCDIYLSWRHRHLLQKSIREKQLLTLSTYQTSNLMHIIASSDLS